MEDIYRSIEKRSEGQITEKRSKFLAFAHPIESIDNVKAIVENYRKEFYDARHICWAYIIGAQGEVYRFNDDGEPSGTAGKPIFGQIISYKLTNILVVVIRYFGGIKLGTSGLITAYKAAASEALVNAVIIEKTVTKTISFSYEYSMMNSVMKIIKDIDASILSQSYDNDCLMSLQIRESMFEELKLRLNNINSLQFIEQ